MTRRLTDIAGGIFAIVLALIVIGGIIAALVL